MKKESISRNLKKIFSVALAAAMATPIVVSANATQVAAAESVTGPAPIASYDFEEGIEGILANDEQAEVANSERIYITKSASELADGEKLDANGLVYTGSGADAKYVVKEAISTPTVLEDSDRGSKVLQFDDQTMAVDGYLKSTSAAIAGDDAATTALDNQIRLYDYYYVEAEEGSKPTKTQDISSELKVSNPFAGLTEELQEYDELEDVGKQKYGGKWVPLWEKGLTITYWVKAPVDENGKYQNSSVLRWENNNEYYFQADDYAKYLTRKKYDKYYALMTDEQKEEALKRSPSGVFMYKDENGNYVDQDNLLDYYFEYQPDWYDYSDETGFVPRMYTDADGLTGPVYNSALITEMNSANGGRFDGYARFYAANPRYQAGFAEKSDGSMEALYTKAIYEDGHDTLPTIKTASGETVIPDTSYFKLNEGDTIDAGTSMVRYALEDGELQIDVDNSIFWVPDNVLGINENKNQPTSYLTKAGMQNADVFFMNSWQDATVTGPTQGKTYDSARYYALSPVSKVDEANANAGTWHQVAITLQNDWVEFYVDGEKVNVEDTYSSRGGTTLDTSKSFKRFNKGAGMRNGAGSEKDMGNIAYGNYVCRLLMDWISDENSELCFGGIGNYAYEYAQAVTASKVCLDDVNFYSSLLSDEQIAAIYEGTYVPDGGEQPGPDKPGTELPSGNITASGETGMDDASEVLKLALAISKTDDYTEAQLKAADVNGDGKVDLEDAKIVLEIALGIR